MKKKFVLWLTFLMLFLAAGCTKETHDIDAPGAEAGPAGGETQEETLEPVKVLIYSGNAAADDFEQKEVEIQGLTPQNLISELAAVNVVSINTEVNSFEQDGKSLKLDLSKGFSQYVNMMGTGGEFIVMGGLVNTFLTAYDADEILITVEGKTLETGHASYENPLGFFEFDTKQEVEPAQETANAEPLKYRLSDATDWRKESSVYYPQFVDMSDKNIQDRWNEAIKEIVKMVTEGATESDPYTLDYEIVTCDTEFVSFVFRRDMGDSGKDTFAISFDLVNRKCVRLSDWGDAMDEAAHNLATGGYYKIISKDMDRESFDEFMKRMEPSADDYKEQFSLYDFDLDNLEEEPYGFSYVRDDELILVMYIPGAAIGDHAGVRATVEIDTGIKVR
ncbi:MAG: hypothetical protein HDR00_00995 [Lachnospiraceae bacterium]|nr:hypothetical protein [Lachnospiraceae bacterium]